GAAMVRRPEQVQILRLWASKPGYATLFRNFETAKKDGSVELPSSFEFPLPKAQTVSGRIVDAKGQSIAGVRIQAQCEVSNDYKLPNGLVYSCNDLATGSDALITDKEGRWSLNNVPVPATSVSLKIAHPDYIPDMEYGCLQKQQSITLA